MYKLIIWKAIWTDSGPETGTDSYILNYKPTFDDMYNLINYVSEKVLKKTGIKLEKEIKILE